MHAHYLSDIDECSEAHPLKMNECHPNTSCINTQGSFNCFCNPRHIGDGFNCKGTLFSAMPFTALELELDCLLINYSRIFKCHNYVNYVSCILN